MKKYFIIEEKGWTDGSGWNYTTTFDCGETEAINADWDEVIDREMEIEDGKDIEYTLKVWENKEAFENEEEPIYEESIWVSEYKNK